MAEIGEVPQISEKDELDKSLQIDEASRLTGEHSIVPPSLGEQILSMPQQELKEQFPVRYEMYRKILQATKNLRIDETSGDSSFSENLSEDERGKMASWLSIMNGLDTYIQSHHTCDNSERTLRDPQMAVFEDIRDALEQGKTKGYVKLPTGVGKTVIFTECVEAADTKTLIVVPTKQLVDQTVDKIEQFAEKVNAGKIYSKQKDFDRTIQVATYDSFVDKVKEGMIKPEEYGLLILDEAHRSLTDLRMDTVRQFDNAIQIGFTATPAFSGDKKVADLLPELYHSMTIREAVEEGLLSPLSSWIVQTDVDMRDVRVSSGEYREEDLEKIINQEARNLQAVELYKRAFDGQTGISYCVSVNHANELAESFKENGVAAAAVSGKTSDVELKEVLDKYRRGEIKMICNADLLIEGFDEVSTSACFNLRPTRSKVMAEQRAGRVLRLDENNPDKKAVIVDFIPKNIDPKHPPVLFRDVIYAAELGEKKNVHADADNAVVEDEAMQSHSRVEVEGLKVITDPEEVMSIGFQKEEKKGELEDSAPLLDLFSKESWSTEEKIEEYLSLENFKQLAKKYRNIPHLWKENPAVRENENGELEYNPELIQYVLVDTAVAFIRNNLPHEHRDETVRKALRKIVTKQKRALQDFFVLRNDPELRAARDSNERRRLLTRSELYRSIFGELEPTSSRIAA